MDKPDIGPAGGRVKTVSPERWRQIEELLDEVLDLDPAERRAHLERRAPDAALRAAVESLVVACELPTRMRGPGALASPLVAELAGEDPDHAALSRIGPYRVIRELGQGGMGTVLLAERDDDQYRKQVAIKVLRRGASSLEAVRRFRHERQILASLDHPGIARLLDGGVLDDGAPYIVMEYIEGLPLDRFCAARELAIGARVRLFGDVCAAVEYAHQQLVVHRDLKPSNILVTGDGAVKLLDFGIAKLTDEGESGEMAPLTRTGVRVMTPEYASPEQVRGGRVTTATDVYALGVLLYELLAGRRPYELEGRSLSEIERVICETDPVRPSTAAGRATGADAAGRKLRGDLDTITMKALQKDPARRYATAAALHEDLTRFLEGRPVLARPDSPVYRARKFVGRHRVAVLAGVVFLGVLAGAGIRERGLRNQAEAEARTADAASDFLVGIFTASDPYEVNPASGRDLTAQALLNRGASRVDSALAGQPELQAQMLMVLGRVYNSLALYDSAASLYGRALERRQAALGDRSPGAAESLTELGAVHVARGRSDSAEPLLRRALELRRLGNVSGDQLARTLDRLATALQQQARYDEAEPLFREALDTRLAAHGEQHLDVAESLNNLAVLFFITARYEEAEPLYRRSIAVRQALLGADHVLVAEVVHNLAQTRQLLGDLDEAERLFRESLPPKRAAFGDAHPRVTVHLNNLGRLLRERGKLDEAEPMIREALVLDRRIFGESHPYVAASLDHLGSLMYDRGRFAEAESLFTVALEMNRRLQGDEHTSVGLNLNNRGLSRYRRGDFGRAEEDTRGALERYRRRLAPDHPTVAMVGINLGQVLRERGRLQEAELLYRDAVRVFEGQLPRMAARLGPALVGLGRTLVAAGRAADAEPLLERGLDLNRERFGEADWRTAEAHLGLGTCLEALGRGEEAGPHLARAREALTPIRDRHPYLAAKALAP